MLSVTVSGKGVVLPRNLGLLAHLKKSPKNLEK